eukprot:UN31152
MKTQKDSIKLVDLNEDNMYSLERLVNTGNKLQTVNEICSKDIFENIHDYDIIIKKTKETKIIDLLELGLASDNITTLEQCISKLETYKRSFSEEQNEQFYNINKSLSELIEKQDDEDSVKKKSEQFYKNEK